MARLTPTSFAILGYLAMKPWSAYELTKQIRDGSRLAWARTEARLYQEPKNLVTAGLAEAKTETFKGRTRTVYTITDAGRDALAGWLTQSSSPPAHEFEALLKIGFGEFGKREHLIETLRQAEQHGREILDAAWEQFPVFLDRVGAEPERLHNLYIYGTFMAGYVELIQSWARWARDEVENRPDDWPQDEVTRLLAAMHPDALSAMWRKDTAAGEARR